MLIVFPISKVYCSNLFNCSFILSITCESLILVKLFTAELTTTAPLLSNIFILNIFPSLDSCDGAPSVSAGGTFSIGGVFSPGVSISSPLPSFGTISPLLLSCSCDPLPVSSFGRLVLESTSLLIINFLALASKSILNNKFELLSSGLYT